MKKSIDDTAKEDTFDSDKSSVIGPNDDDISGNNIEDSEHSIATAPAPASAGSETFLVVDPTAMIY